ncbi:hypothetical protein J7E78_25885 [Paenibacillus polymyxa]|uniref:hypothetical protein n=1 Tax=Paenibacillus polymyxa TaxID=1406 RepID=UPI001BE9B56F|nr:hypothetical protein [Paenibacillus polymyxa]MBT2286955.1 hypothetical protein [Paenibacillus polymyxa]
MILQSILSFILSLLAVFLPVIIVLFLKGPFKLFLYLSPLFQLLLAVIAYYAYPIFYNKHDSWGWILFYSVITSASLVLFFILITSAIKGIRKILYESTNNAILERLRLLFYLVYFITIPHLVFALIYAFWGIVSKAENITLFESIYFSYSLIYSLPVSKTIDDYRSIITDENSIQLLYMVHVVISKAFEIVVLAFVASRFIDYIKPTQED